MLRGKGRLSAVIERVTCYSLSPAVRLRCQQTSACSCWGLHDSLLPWMGWHGCCCAAGVQGQLLQAQKLKWAPDQGLSPCSRPW